MAVTNVSVNVLEQETALTNTSTNIWEADIDAPGVESWDYYPVTLKVVSNDITFTKDDTDYTFGKTLRLVVDDPTPIPVTNVYITVNGETVNLVKTRSKRWETDMVAPQSSMGDGDKGYYVVLLGVESPDITIEKDDTDYTFGKDLRLYITENIPPVITMITPTDGAYLRDVASIHFRVKDEDDGSGTNPNSVILKIDNVQVTGFLVIRESALSYRFYYEPTGFLEGEHSIYVYATDNAGNAAELTSTFIVDTVAPTLDLIDFSNNIIVNNATFTVNGVTNDANLPTVTVTVTLNGQDVGTVTVNEDGTFHNTITFTEGQNRVIITARDAAGNSTTIERNVLCDVTPPDIRSIVLSPDYNLSSGTRVKIRTEVY